MRVDFIPKFWRKSTQRKVVLSRGGQVCINSYTVKDSSTVPLPQGTRGLSPPGSTT